MKCRQARAKISAYMDHELDAASSRQLESHLRWCVECREVLDDFQELNDMVLSLPKIELDPDFAAQMVRKVSGTGTASKIKRQVRSSLFERLSRIAEDFVDLVSSARSPSIGALDEFSDFPPLSMSYIYFNLMDLNALRRDRLKLECYEKL